MIIFLEKKKKKGWGLVARKTKVWLKGWNFHLPKLQGGQKGQRLS